MLLVSFLITRHSHEICGQGKGCVVKEVLYCIFADSTQVSDVSVISRIRLGLSPQVAGTQILSAAIQRTLGLISKDARMRMVTPRSALLTYICCEFLLIAHHQAVFPLYLHFLGRAFSWSNDLAVLVSVRTSTLTSNSIYAKKFLSCPLFSEYITHKVRGSIALVSSDEVLPWPPWPWNLPATAWDCSNLAIRSATLPGRTTWNPDSFGFGFTSDVNLSAQPLYNAAFCGGSLFVGLGSSGATFSSGCIP